MGNIGKPRQGYAKALQHVQNSLQHILNLKKTVLCQIVLAAKIKSPEIYGMYMLVFRELPLQKPASLSVANTSANFISLHTQTDEVDLRLFCFHRSLRRFLTLKMRIINDKLLSSAT